MPAGDEDKDLLPRLPGPVNTIMPPTGSGKRHGGRAGSRGATALDRVLVALKLSDGDGTGIKVLGLEPTPELLAISMGAPLLQGPRSNLTCGAASLNFLTARRRTGQCTLSERGGAVHLAGERAQSTLCKASSGSAGWPLASSSRTS